MTFDKFMQERKLQHIRPSTIKNDIRVLKPLNKHKPLDECTADDLKQYIERYIQKFEAEHKRKPDIGNLNFIYNSIRKYYLWAGKPEAVSWIKTKNALKNINQNKLVTPAEVQTMLRVCDNDRDKCMIAITYESGMRIGEVLSLRVSDIKIKDSEYQVRIPDNYEGDDVNCKTGTRSMTLIESLPYIQKYLNIHDGGTLLFDIKRNRSEEILRNIAKKAGIEKKVTWRLMRHTRATELTRLGMQETQLKKRFGWTGDSKMIRRYTHITDADADDGYKEALGIGFKKKDITINPIARRCVKCGKLIETGEYCEQCSEIQRLIKLNEKMHLEKEELRQQIENQEAAFFIQNHGLGTLKETIEKLQHKVADHEAYLGFQTMDGAQAWEPGTGNVIEWKKDEKGNIARTVRKPTPEDYTPSNPLAEPASEAITNEEKEHAKEVNEKQKEMINVLHAKGELSATEKAKKVIEKLKKE